MFEKNFVRKSLIWEIATKISINLNASKRHQCWNIFSKSYKDYILNINCVPAKAVIIDLLKMSDFSTSPKK